MGARVAWAAAPLAALTGCLAPPRGPFDAPKAAAAQRLMQSRRYETRDEVKVLRASAALLLDLGFLIDCAEDSVGVLVASKRRTAVNTTEVISMLLASILARSDMPYDSHQRFRASVVTHLSGEKSVVVRATFQRIVWDSRGRIARREQLNDPEFYQEFFEKLSTSLVLEADLP
jgi:hypothetical protein